MSTLKLTIDDKQVVADEGATLLEAARAEGISIPTLCHHEELEPFGGCRLCIVEIERRGRRSVVVSCVHPVLEGLTVFTQSEKLTRLRKTVLELLSAHAPNSPSIVKLAEQYGVDRNRFEPESSFCIHCGLCVRYCAEVEKKFAVGFVSRGVQKEISFVPELAGKVCEDCKRCFPLCPTSYLQAAYLLTNSTVDE